MIKLSNLEKYFNKNRSNEIHVINDINLALPQSGLVVLLGPSGSGKTTLLNVLGGLDKVQSGIIEFDDQIIEKYNPNKWDTIRNEHIGYIFQNYNLITDISVRDNIAVTLNMVGIYDKDEIDRRVEYILSQMGMEKFKRRKAGQLSGGQQQRVAIARALAKNPKIIIADEPTGNLDSKNTYDIMNIIKSISQQKLVVLVTHERQLAQQFGDRIIELKDGQIVEDHTHHSTGSQNVSHETDIYLKDFSKLTEVTDKHASVKVYTDDDVEANFNIRLIVKNKTLYVDVDTNHYQRINLLDKNTEMNIYDENISREEVEHEVYPFELDDHIDDSYKTNKYSAISVKESIKQGFRRFRDERRGVKVINLMFMVVSGFIALAVAMITNVIDVNVHDYISVAQQTVAVNTSSSFTFNQSQELKNEDHIGFIEYYDYITFEIGLPDVYQSSSIYSYTNYTGIPITFLDEDDIVYGEAPTDHNQIVINENYLINLIQNNSNYATFGITKVEDFLNLSISYEIATGEYTYTSIEGEIVGITREDNPVFYATEETIYSMAYKVGIYEMYENELSLNISTLQDDEYIFLSTQTTPINLEMINGEYFTEGLRSTPVIDVPSILIPLESLQKAYYENYFSPDYQDLNVLSFDIDQTLQYFATLDLDAVALYETQLIQAREYRITDAIGILSFAGVFLIASALSTFFILRSSLLSRIYEVSVYRALGAKKRDLKKLFFIETLIITTLTSLVGYILVSFVIHRIQLASNGLVDVIKITPVSFIAGMILIYIVNIISGMIPITSLLRQTPSQIMSRYDF